MKKTARILLGLVFFVSLLPVGASQGEALESGEYHYTLTTEGTATITRWLGSSAQPEIPGTLDGHAVTRIGENAFRDCGTLVRARIPDGVKAIGEMAFYGCTALVDLTLPLSLREIGDLAFAYCTSLESVTILEGVERIGEFAFGECPKLWRVILPASVTEIGPDAFFGMEAGLLPGIFGYEGSYVQEYAQANGINFFPLTQNSGPPAEDGPPFLEPVSEDGPPAEEAGRDMVTAEIIVRFPHAERTGAYTGEMMDGVPHGQGSFTAVSGSGVRYTYEGAWANGAMSGYGEMTWSDGLALKGTWRESQPVEGEWLIDGAVVYTGGLKMCAECGVNVFHGQGKLMNRLGQTIYEGPFRDGLLDETAEARAARALGLDPVSERLTGEDYAVMLSSPGAGSGRQFRLEGLIGEVFRDEEHGWGQFTLLHSGSEAMPFHVDYRYGVGEERVTPGRRATVWGVVTGTQRVTDSRGREHVLPALDADVVELSGERPAQGTAELKLTAFKVLEGRPLRNREFSFALDETFTVLEERINPLDGTVILVPMAFSSRLQEKGNDRDGAVVFDSVHYTKKDIGGVFNYTITEIPGFEAEMAYDPMVMSVTVIVTDAGDGTPASMVLYPEDETFNNSVALLTIPHVFEVTAELRGRALQAGEFSFELWEGPVLLQTAVNDAAGQVSFQPVAFTAADTGTTRSFTVRQVPGTLPGVSYDPMVVSIDITADPDPGGIGLPMLTIPLVADTVFNNVFSAQGEAGLSFTVVLEGREIRNGEFSFELLKDGATQQTGRNDRSGSIAFTPVGYTEADIGRTFIYTARQIPGKESGMSYDSSEKTVWATVVDAGDGTLRADLSFPDGRTFTNRAPKPVTGPSLSRVDVDKTEMETGEIVIWIPVVSQGTKPYRYHYRLFRDGEEYKDIGWIEDASRVSQLNNPGVWQIEVTVEDAKGLQSKTVRSPEVTVKAPAWTPMDLSGRWIVSHVISDMSGTAKTETKVGDSVSYEWMIQMKDGNSGTFTSNFGKFSGNTGTITYDNNTIKAEIQCEWQRDTYEGEMKLKDGSVTFEGNRIGKRKKI